MHSFLFLLVGAASGALSVAVGRRTVRLWDVDAGPGLYFAVIVGAALVAEGVGRTWRLLVWMAFAVAGWIFAVRTALEVLDWRFIRVADSMPLIGVFAGLAGGLTVAAGGAMLSSRLRSWVELALVVLVGATAGLLFRDPVSASAGAVIEGTAREMPGSGGSRGDWLLYTVWQGAVAGAIGFGLRKSVVRDGVR
jgi:hypothetical protein